MGGGTLPGNVELWNMTIEGSEVFLLFCGSIFSLGAGTAFITKMREFSIKFHTHENRPCTLTPPALPLWASSPRQRSFKGPLLLGNRLPGLHNGVQSEKGVSGPTTVPGWAGATHRPGHTFSTM